VVLLPTLSAEFVVQRAVEDRRGYDDAPDEVGEEEHRRDDSQSAVERGRLLELRQEQVGERAVEQPKADRDEEGAWKERLVCPELCPRIGGYNLTLMA
jgi:hypothetical protein